MPIGGPIPMPIDTSFHQLVWLHSELDDFVGEIPRHFDKLA
jgi:hypothetical protein